MIITEVCHWSELLKYKKEHKVKARKLSNKFSQLSNMELFIWFNNSTILALFSTNFRIGKKFNLFLFLFLIYNV